MTLTADNTPEQASQDLRRAQEMKALLVGSSFDTDTLNDARVVGARLMSDFDFPEGEDGFADPEVQEQLGRDSNESGDQRGAEAHLLAAWRLARVSLLKSRLGLTLAGLYLQRGEHTLGAPYLLRVFATGGDYGQQASYQLAVMSHDAGDDQACRLLLAMGTARSAAPDRKLERLTKFGVRRALKLANDERDARTLFLSGCHLHVQDRYEEAYFFYLGAMELQHPMAVLGVASLFRYGPEGRLGPGRPLWLSAKALLERPPESWFTDQRELAEQGVPPPPGPEITPSPSDDHRTRDALNTLVRDAISGNGRAVHDLLAIIRPVVVRYSRARLVGTDHSQSIADDIAQDVCLAVLRALPKYSVDGRPFLSFVYGIARHKIIDFWRRASSDRAELMPTLPEVVSHDRGPEESVVGRSDFMLMQNLLAQLPPKQREILILRVVVGLSAEETAQAVDATPGAVRVAQHRAITKLRQLVGPESTTRHRSREERRHPARPAGDAPAKRDGGREGDVAGELGSNEGSFRWVELSPQAIRRAPGERSSPNSSHPGDLPPGRVGCGG